MPKRTDDATEQIKTARAMPSGYDEAEKRPDSQQVKDAEKPTEGHTGAPSVLPGYGR